MRSATVDPWVLRQRRLTEALTLAELGRVLYHLAKKRHFRGRDLEETEGEDEAKPEEKASPTGASPSLPN